MNIINSDPKLFVVPEWAWNAIENDDPVLAGKQVGVSAPTMEPVFDEHRRRMLMFLQDYKLHESMDREKSQKCKRNDFDNEEDVLCLKLKFIPRRKWSRVEVDIENTDKANVLHNFLLHSSSFSDVGNPKFNDFYGTLAPVVSLSFDTILTTEELMDYFINSKEAQETYGVQNLSRLVRPYEPRGLKYLKEVKYGKGDLVKCDVCSWIGLVTSIEGSCPCCGSSGWLSWYQKDRHHATGYLHIPREMPYLKRTVYGLGDDVKCMNCEWAGLVQLGFHKCPNCGEGGTLSWKDSEKQEAIGWVHVPKKDY